MPILKKTAEGILKKNLEQGVHLRWMTGEEGKIKNVKIAEETDGAEYSDGSRREGQTAAATTRDAWYLGTTATVMDAEMLGIAMGWAREKKVATESAQTPRGRSAGS